MTEYRPNPRLSTDDVKHMTALTAALPTKSAKIRTLDAAGYSRSEIAGFLGIRYQHVRNVLVQSGLRPAAAVATAPPAQFAEGALPRPDANFEAEETNCGVFDVDAAGRITLPPALLKAVDALPSRRVPWRLENGEVILMSIDAAMRQIDQLMGELKQRPGSMVDELIAERRAEFEREERKFAGRTPKDD